MNRVTCCSVNLDYHINIYCIKKQSKKYKCIVFYKLYLQLPFLRSSLKRKMLLFSSVNNSSSLHFLGSRVGTRWLISLAHGSKTGSLQFLSGLAVWFWCTHFKSNDKTVTEKQIKKLILVEFKTVQLDNECLVLFMLLCFSNIENIVQTRQHIYI